VVEETEGGKGDESLHVKGTSRNKDLCQQITKCPSNKRGACLGGQRALIQSPVVCGPSGNSTSTNKGRIAEKRALSRCVLAEGRLNDVVIQSDRGDAFGDGRVLDTESAGARRDKEETKKLHGGCYNWYF